MKEGGLGKEVKRKIGGSGLGMIQLFRVLEGPLRYRNFHMFFSNFNFNKRGVFVSKRHRGRGEHD